MTAERHKQLATSGPPQKVLELRESDLAQHLSVLAPTLRENLRDEWIARCSSGQDFSSPQN